MLREQLGGKRLRLSGSRRRSSTHSVEGTLCPAQQRALDQLHSGSSQCDVLHLRARDGTGRTTVLRALQHSIGGVLLTIRDFVDTVLVDDLHLATAVMTGCHFYPRSGLLEAPMSALASQVVDEGKKLVLGTTGGLSEPLRERCFEVTIEAFAAEDYRHLCSSFLQNSGGADLDAEKIHRFAPKLNGHQLRSTCAAVLAGGTVDTEAYLEVLRRQKLTSNVELGEVAQVELGALKGVDDVVRSLEANIVLPLENDALAQELNLTPKRGVLLVGPPGTGKTTVGRALAHRLKGKFFLVDGTFISGTRDFYERVHRVFELAKENAPRSCSSTTAT